jgi:hypothetical protein|tara:strand:+ start:148 stop:525 length:378 start_codon:yes stop_codon:yes gene_type:complete
MISICLVNNLTTEQKIQCNELIDNNFKVNRFNDYTNVVIYILGNNIVGFVGIYDNLLNQLCTSIENRRSGIATKIINTCIKTMKKPINLFIDKDKETTDYLLSFYTKRKFEIEYENDVEYKMIYK